MKTAATLVHVELALALKLMGHARASGFVTLRADHREARLVLVKGAVLHATSTTAPRLGEALVAGGVVSREVLENTLRFQRRKKVKQPLATILLELGVLAKAVAESEVEAQIMNVLVDALSWHGCMLQFEPAVVAADHVVFPNSCHLDALLTRLARARQTAGA